MLLLDRPMVMAGEALVARGAGCDPFADVTLTSDGEPVGRTVADAEGHFEAVVQFGTFKAGPRTIYASCGVIMTAPVEMALASSTSGTSSTFVLLLFFMVAGYLVVRFQIAEAYRPRRR